MYNILTYLYDSSSSSSSSSSNSSSNNNKVINIITIKASWKNTDGRTLKSPTDENFRNHVSTDDRRTRI